MIRILLIAALLAAPAVAQDRNIVSENCTGGAWLKVEGKLAWVCPAMAEEPYYSAIPQEPSRDAQLLEFYRLRITNLERQVQVYEANDAEHRKVIASQAETIKMWEGRSSGKVSKKEWAVLVLSGVAAIGTVIGRVKGQ